MPTTYTDDERAAYRQLKREEAEGRLDALLSEEGWRTWLQLRRNIHEFSWTNQVLIAMQAYERGVTPTIVKAAWRWKRDGYHPAKGSKAFSIWVFKSRRRKDGTWSCCGSVQPSRQCPKCGKQDHYFSLGPVFNASDVRSFETGEPPVIELPAGEPIEGDELDWLIEPLAHHAVAEDWIGSADLGATSDHGEGGSWNTRTRELRVCSGGSGNARLRVLIHELAHARGITSKDVELSYGECEVAVECVSYIVAGSVGLDTSGEAIPYIAGWGGEGARAKVRALAQLIDAVAKELEAPVKALVDARAELVAA